ncbi:MAG TPA: DegT/DnrJ/EryC1/StrS family aminotransferase [Terracidiphilus sp.]|nr:DegT/DnrJ/EryC1/StrS family aminotransferase [Terracidiphilus sp.]
MNARIPLSAPDITEAEIDAVTAVLRTPHLCSGPELTAFESALARYHLVDHALAVSSGTAGLHLALVALGIGEGDEVIVPSFAFVAVANTVRQVRALPVFADIDAATLNLDPTAVEQAITPRTRAMVVVHTFGVPADMDALGTIARRHSLVLVEDACEAIGAEFDGRRVGGFGDLAVLGFYPNKQITTGEGGAVLCRDARVAARLRSLRNQGRTGAEWLDHVEPGFNYRLSDLACALGRVQLGRIDEILQLRAQAAERYDALLRNVSGDIPSLELPPLELERRKLSWFIYAIRLPENVNRERVQAIMTRQGIATGRYFAPLHQQPALCGELWRDGKRLAVTEQIAPRMLALPFFNRITASDQMGVADALRGAIDDARQSQHSPR